MAFTVRNLKDTDFETVVLVLITGTNGTAAEVVDASGLAGASTDPRPVSYTHLTLPTT